jgi:hypothetical protein
MPSNQRVFSGFRAMLLAISKPQYSCLTPFYRRQQAHPHAINRNATRNNSAPTGKIAAIRIPAPNATAKIPRTQNPP